MPAIFGTTRKGDLILATGTLLDVAIFTVKDLPTKSIEQVGQEKKKPKGGKKK